MIRDIAEHVTLLSGERVGKRSGFLQSDGTHHVYDNTVSSVSWNFPRLELNVNRLIEERVRYQIV